MRRVLQGWLDITYLDPLGDFRLSRGNKGTLFVLTRDEPAKSRLLAALTARSSSAEVTLPGYCVLTPILQCSAVTSLHPLFALIPSHDLSFRVVFGIRKDEAVKGTHSGADT